MVKSYLNGCIMDTLLVLEEGMLFTLFFHASSRYDSWKLAGHLVSKLHQKFELVAAAK